MDQPSWIASCSLEDVSGLTGIIHGISVSSDYRGKGMCSSTGRTCPCEMLHLIFCLLAGQINGLWERGEPVRVVAVLMPLPWHGMLHTQRDAWSSGISDPMAWALCSVFCHLPSHCSLGSLDIYTRGPLTHTIIPPLSKVWAPVLILKLERKYSPACYDYRSAWALINQRGSTGVTQSLRECWVGKCI